MKRNDPSAAEPIQSNTEAQEEAAIVAELQQRFEALKRNDPPAAEPTDAPKKRHLEPLMDTVVEEHQAPNLEQAEGKALSMKERLSNTINEIKSAEPKTQEDTDEHESVNKPG